MGPNWDKWLTYVTIGLVILAMVVVSAFGWDFSGLPKRLPGIGGLTP
ncbi:hypothetical protein [Devosia indica]